MGNFHYTVSRKLVPPTNMCWLSFSMVSCMIASRTMLIDIVVKSKEVGHHIDNLRRSSRRVGSTTWGWIPWSIHLVSPQEYSWGSLSIKKGLILSLPNPRPSKYGAFHDLEIVEKLLREVLLHELLDLFDKLLSFVLVELLRPFHKLLKKTFKWGDEQQAAFHDLISLPEHPSMKFSIHPDHDLVSQRFASHSLLDFY